MTAEAWISVAGKKFHPWWLRDNCHCSQCRHPSSFQKIYDISASGKMPSILRFSLDQESLSIDWDEKPAHTSQFSVQWLMADLRRSEVDNYPKTYWKTDDWKHNKLPWHSIKTAQDEPHAWADDLLRYGFVLFKGVDDEKTLDQFISSIGPIHYTEYGRFAHIQSQTNACDVSETGYALSPHTDYSTYMFAPPLLQFMYLKENNAEGGESILVDGFKASQDFKVKHPAFYQVLINTPIEFQQFYQNWHYHFIRKRPLIEENAAGQVSGIYFGHSHCFNWGLPIDTLEIFYLAYCEYFRMLKSDEYKMRIRLNAGECVAVQNARVLHGREAFDPHTGNRHLVGGYVSWDFFEARHNFKMHQAFFCDEKNMPVHKMLAS